MGENVTIKTNLIDQNNDGDDDPYGMLFTLFSLFFFFMTYSLHITKFNFKVESASWEFLGQGSLTRVSKTIELHVITFHLEIAF